MTAQSYVRGHRVRYDGSAWRYCDTDALIDAERPCVRCGLTAVPDGPDPCLGMLPGVISACCGHGVEQGWAIRHVVYPIEAVA